MGKALVFDSERKVRAGAYADESAARHRLPQGAKPHPSKQPPLWEGVRPSGRFSSSRSLTESLPSGRDKVDYPKEDEWTAREACDYALKRASGHAVDEERVAIAIFYSMLPDPGNCYAAMDEKGKERMRWCARAAIAALKLKS